jgi:hypothetical protein
MSSQKEYDRFMANLQTKIKAEEIGMKSWGKSRPTAKQLSRPTVDYFLNSATKLDNEQKKQGQMLEQYLENQKTPIVRIGRDGKPHEYKYHAVPPPVLEDATIIMRDGSEGFIPVIHTEHEIAYDEEGNQIEGPLKTREVLKSEVLREFDIRNKENQIHFQSLINERRDIINNIEEEIERLKNELIRLEQERNDQVRYLYTTRDEELTRLKNIDRSRLSAKEKKSLTKQQTAFNATLKSREQKFYDDFSRFKREILEAIREYTHRITDIKEEIRLIGIEEEHGKERAEENKARVEAVVKRNDEKIRIYQNELSALNSGILSTDRQPFEDDVAYINRMELLSDQPYADNRNLFKSEMQNKQTLRENLLTITRNKATIDSVVNSLASQGDSSLIFFVNQSFEGIKNDILKRFGRDNELITPLNILEYIRRYLHKTDPRNYQVAIRDNFVDDTSSISGSEAVYPQDVGETIDYSNYDEEVEIPLFNNPLASASSNPALQPPTIGKSIIVTNVGGPLEDKYLQLTNIRNGKSIYIKIKEGGTPAKPKIIPYLSETNDKGSYVQKNYATNDREHGLRLKSAEILEINPSLLSAIVPDKDSSENYLMNVPDFFFTDAEIVGTKPKLKVDGTPYKDATISYGLGLHMHSDPKTIPEYINFGDKQLLLKKLFLSNILSIINKHHKKVNGFNNVKVSDTFVEIIYDIIHNKNYQSKLNKINENEKSIFDHLLKVCNLHKQLVGAGVVSLDKLKKDLQILEGEIQAGNNNKHLKKKLYDLLQKMVHYNLISAPQSIKHFKQYETFFK